MRLLKKFIKILVLVAAGALLLLFLVGQFAPRRYLGTVSVTLSVPVADVYNWLTDVDDTPNRDRQVTRIEYESVNNKGFPVWREYREEKYSSFEVLEMEKNKRFTIQTRTSNFGLHGLWAYVLKQQGDGATTVEITEESHTTSLINNVIFTLIGRKYTLKQELRLLEKFAEGFSGN
ncbi:MAG: SRPBCC family protein [Verrucomicrobiota bacterium]